MPDSQVPWPRSDRLAYLLLLDKKRRLLLCGGCCGRWSVPQIRVGASTDFEDAATRFLLEEWHVQNPRFGSVYGTFESRLGETWEFDRATTSRALIIHVSDEQGELFEGSAPSHVRWGVSDLRRRRREISPEGLVSLVTGYVEGWIPDGPISLF
ncbi:NUDIX domain-containing protein [Streptomyces sp. DSM 116496]|uniref:NUDIX domain-containing protein n=1 Tax=Streptomyces stoeckheimensis TaxID=3344656 RepID=UPI0038B350B5